MYCVTMVCVVSLLIRMKTGFMCQTGHVFFGVTALFQIVCCHIKVLYALQ